MKTDMIDGKEYLTLEGFLERSEEIGLGRMPNIKQEIQILYNINKKYSDGSTLSVCLCHCGKIWTTVKWKVINKKIICCGCRTRLQTENLVGKVFGRLTVICLIGYSNNRARWKCVCNCENKTEIITSSNRLKNGNPVSCGCQRKISSPKGNKHSNWNPILTDEDRAKSKFKQRDNQLSQKCFKRDNYRCVACGHNKGNFAAHHLDCWQDHLDKRLDLNNVITLCTTKKCKNGKIKHKGCHQKFHKKYGKTHNTKEQFEEFLINIESKLCQV